MNNLPKIKAEVIGKMQHEDSPWDFLYLFIDEYYRMMERDKSIIEYFNPLQHTLLAFNYLYCQVCNGGFIQLIKNRYGAYIFESLFTETIKQWGVQKKLPLS